MVEPIIATMEAFVSYWGQLRIVLGFFFCDGLPFLHHPSKRKSIPTSYRHHFKTIPTYSNIHSFHNDQHCLQHRNPSCAHVCLTEAQGSEGSPFACVTASEETLPCFSLLSLWSVTLLVAWAAGCVFRFLLGLPIGVRGKHPGGIGAAAHSN